MKIAPLPATEQARLAQLRQLNVLDTLPDLDIDSLTHLARDICGTSIAAVSLVDETRQWFKSIVGLDACETPRDVAFCAHAILEEGPLIVQDALNDSRFLDNPLVTGAPGIRFYAGIPLVTSNNFSLGTLCVIDTVPKVLTESQLTALHTLAKQVMINIEMQHAQSELRSSELHFRTIFEQAGVGVSMCEAMSGTFINVNEKYSQIVGYTLEELQSLNFKAITHPDDHQLQAEKTAGLLSGQYAEYIIEKRYIRKNGSIVWVNLTCSAIWNEGERPTHHIAVVEDITLRKEAAIAIQEAKNSAEKTAKIKSEFLANMSHEIRTPMNGIIGLSQLVLNQTLSPENRDYISKIHSSSQSLLSILNDILDFSKLEAGRMSIENRAFNLDMLFNNLQDLFENHAQSKQLYFKIQLSDGTPRDLLGDEQRIQQILSNLIGNAIKFTEQGGITINVTTWQLESSHVRLTFTVEDTGIGISEEDIGKLFQPFSQVDGSITRRFGGTGLGLAISQNLLVLMGSQFNVTSQVGQGTTFSFDLLLNIPTQIVIGKAHNHTGHKANALGDHLANLGQSLKGACILVAEDNTINQMIVREFLILSGMNVALANNGEETLEILKHQKVDAILMDMHMPVMDGLEATRMIRQNPKYKGLPILALSAGVTQEEQDICLSSGMNEFIPKPINPEKLIAALVSWIKLPIDGLYD